MDDTGSLEYLRGRLRNADILRNLSEPELQAVVALGHVREVEAGERLAYHGSRGTEIYTVLDGELRLLAGDGEDEVAVRLVHVDETVPLAALIDPPVLVTTVEAATDGHVFAISRSELIELCETQPTIGLRVFQAAARILEQRYSTTLDGLAGSLRSALQVAQSGTSPPGAPV